MCLTSSEFEGPSAGTESICPGIDPPSSAAPFPVADGPNERAVVGPGRRTLGAQAWRAKPAASFGAMMSAWCGVEIPHSGCGSPREDCVCDDIRLTLDGRGAACRGKGSCSLRPSSSPSTVDSASATRPGVPGLRQHRFDWLLGDPRRTQDFAQIGCHRISHQALDSSAIPCGNRSWAAVYGGKLLLIGGTRPGASWSLPVNLPPVLSLGAASSVRRNRPGTNPGEDHDSRPPMTLGEQS
jgi:hypothetical protein